MQTFDIFLVEKMSYIQIGNGPFLGFCYVPTAQNFIERIVKNIPPSGLDRVLYLGYIGIKEAQLDEYLALKIECMPPFTHFTFAILFPAKNLLFLPSIFTATDVYITGSKHLWEIIDPTNTSKSDDIYSSLIEFCDKYAPQQLFSIKEGLDEALHSFYKDISNSTIQCSENFKRLVIEYFQYWK
ncbi:hypothetical protein GFC01_17240 [Desulfofundulus thermobenzoicus]|uniref:Uncharacterized protein n=1 Tax=Desulfofundulus thermobenzoicus TaxID=29376 RepID=A0A6N7IV56_9FIRM|nr:hypothetical protein [Desulfofundulus thermobenzoicus]MQL53970.1 hypothetical protein [Desulfofundulus thermobenzoicus]